MAGHIASSGSAQWRTPKRILDPVRKFFIDGIDLDPCASVSGGIGARVDYMLPANGLEKPWVGTVFCNPPFGTSWVFKDECLTPKAIREREAEAGLKNGTFDLTRWRKQTVSQWVDKAHHHDKAGEAETILLLPAAVDTKWWQLTIFPFAGAICFVEGRVKFVGAAQGAPMATALAYFGDKASRFKKTFAELGYCA